MAMSLKTLSERHSADEIAQPDLMKGEACAVLDLLDAWVLRGWLRELDRHFAAFVLDQDSEASPLLLFAAAMVSHQLGRGHSCLDLNATLTAPDFSLTIPPERAPTEKDQPIQWEPSALLANITLEAWRTALLGSALVEEGGNACTQPAGPLVLSGDKLYLRRYWNYEQQIAGSLQQRLQQTVSTPENLRGLLDELFPASEIKPDWQKIACAVAARGNFSIITGGPGTGKTTTVLRLLAMLQSQALAAGKPLRFALAAPTGKAAARLGESIAKGVKGLDVDDAVRAAIPTNVSTLHSLLGSIFNSRQFKHQRNNPLLLDVLVVDEASMMDVHLMACVLDALPAAARLILLGDKDQLASVDAGSVLGDLCQQAAANGLSKESADWIKANTGEEIGDQALNQAAHPLAQQIVVLRHAHRFGESSGIARLAALVNQKKAEQARQLLKANNPQLFNLNPKSTEASAFTKLYLDGHPEAAGEPKGYRHYLELIEKCKPDEQATLECWEKWAKQTLDAFDCFRLLCAVRQGPWGVVEVNRRITAELAKQGMIDTGHEWYEGRPVILTRNDYSLDVRNGDVGIALRVPLGKHDAKGRKTMVLAVALPDNRQASKEATRVRFISPSRLNDVETTFAMTVHKSQGSEFTHTALVLPDAQSRVLTRELVYTAITRSSTWFTLVEPKEGIFEEAIQKNVQRMSGLVERLHEALENPS